MKKVYKNVSILVAIIIAFWLGRNIDQYIYFDDEKIISDGLSANPEMVLTRNLSASDKWRLENILKKSKKVYFRSRNNACVRYMPRKDLYSDIKVVCWDFLEKKYEDLSY